MLLLSEVRDWIKTLDTGADNFYIGRLDAKKDKSVGIYPLKVSEPPTVALGGLKVSKTDKKSITILVHWNKNAKETEIAAIKLYEKLLGAGSVRIGTTKVNYFKLLVPEPVDVGTDDSKVYERVIQVQIYYER
ncbi:MAG: minor capsid protein [Eubacterium sp.]